jgi:hypothetical protein
MKYRVAAALIAASLAFAGQPALAQSGGVALPPAAELSPEATLAEMERLHGAIIDIAKVQTASEIADGILDMGKEALKAGKTADAATLLGDLTSLSAFLELELSVRVVDREGVQSGFEFKVTDGTYYYLVVEAIDPEGTRHPTPVVDEARGVIETVTPWAIRVGEDVYRRVEADKKDDGVVQNAGIGAKPMGFLEIEYGVPVAGTLSSWE